MTRIFKTISLAAAPALLVLATSLTAAPAKLTVQVDKPGHQVSPTLYGIFFEEINCSGDGGLYPELVRNRSFEDSDQPENWVAVGKTSLAIDTQNPSTASEYNRKSLRVDVAEVGSRAGVVNDGWWGMAVKAGEKYKLTLFARSDANFKGGLTVSLESETGKVYASTRISRLGPAWRQHSATLTANCTDPKARLVIASSGTGTFWLDFVSVLPAKTWKNHGLRPDLAEMLADLKPAFMRFPGGCWVEGRDASESMRWKTTIGPAIDRRTQFNIWGYQSTNGLGYHEYLQLCEDLKCEPLFVINCGMSHGAPVPLDKMDEFVQDALDAIEYANGPVTSKWGALRAKAGHPKPFGLKYLEIGNENGGAAYNERWPLFVNAIKARYPDMHLIANEWGGTPSSPSPEIIDEHYYSNPEFFIENANKYDTYDRSGPQIYVGEYACTQGCGQGNLRAALGEAAFMTGMERNSDVVSMCSYAPLFVNVNHRAWNPNLIDFDSSRAYGIPSYYVQQMFSENRGGRILPVSVDCVQRLAEPTHGAIGVGTWLTEAEYKDIVVTQGDKVLFKSDFSNGADGWKMPSGDWKVVDGALRETKIEDNCRAMAGDPKWTEYTMTLKARKISGEEGFLILFRVAGENSYAWWNIGGWGNTQNALAWAESSLGEQVPGSVETGKWYDIKIEVGSERVKCYLDGKLMHDEPYPLENPLHSSATLDTNGDVVLKVVNTSSEPQEAQVNLDGVRRVAPKAKVTVLTSANGTDENSLDEPERVSPKTSDLNVTGTSFGHTFSANSLTIMRFGKG